ncbi:MAG: hydrogenase maturation nickel metallochaperone HypA [Coriobacteriia bacterium]|nr:hydrogenase maturation nickel metallochaperone HypA [Coriobacteriia bacterium]
MHEMSIMESVFDNAQEACKSSGYTTITRIELTFGEMTEISEDSLRFAFDALKEGSPAAGAELAITVLPPRSQCLECGAEYEHDRFSVRCPECGSVITNLLQGREMRIDAIEAQ